MAYNVNGKVYTSNALMDEIVYCCKRILDGIIIKNDIAANDSEPENFMDTIEIFMMINNGNINIDLFPLTKEILIAYGYSDLDAIRILENRDLIEDKDAVLEFACRYFLDHYEEQNNYYRTLNGLPPYGTDEYDVYIDRTYIPGGYNKEIDFSKPLHKMDKSIINIIQSSGNMDKIISEYKGSNYSYIRFLGDYRVDIYKARKADKYDILYIPNVEPLVLNRFIELYNLNKEIYLRRIYSEAFSYNSDYYEECMILAILAETFNNIITEVPEWYIRRDIFDIRSVQYFLDSYGVKFFKEIPLKYQIRIVKNLNKLIKYKSSNKNFEDILSIFALKESSIYKYYLYKKRRTDKDGNYVTEGSVSDKYDLEFVKSKFDESYDNSIKDLVNRTPYDTITYEDQYWDGEEDHNVVKNKHMNRDFTIENTKYMSIDYSVNMSEYLVQMQYFLGLIMSSGVDTDDIKIVVTSIDPNIGFKVKDLFLLLQLLTLGYDDIPTTIIRPSDIDYSAEPVDFVFKFRNENNNGNVTKKYRLRANIEPKIWETSHIKYPDQYYDWMKHHLPSHFVLEDDRMYGFNTEVKLDELEEIISHAHSQSCFKAGFTLADLGVDKYIAPSKISTIEELMKIYFNNKECYDNIKSKMFEECDDRYEMVSMRYVFDQLFTCKFDNGKYMVDGKDAERLDQVLQDRDYILYNVYNRIMSESNLESRREVIRNIMNDVIGTLEFYLSREGLDYIFSFATTSSFNSLITYIYLMINFFKSYKVYFLDPYVTYVADDKLENSSNIYDCIGELNMIYDKADRQFVRDNCYINAIMEHESYANNKSILNIISQFEAIENDNLDYDGGHPGDNYAVYKDINGGPVNIDDNLPYRMVNGNIIAEGMDISETVEAFLTETYDESSELYRFINNEFYDSFTNRNRYKLLTNKINYTHSMVDFDKSKCETFFMDGVERLDNIHYRDKVNSWKDWLDNIPKERDDTIGNIEYTSSKVYEDCISDKSEIYQSLYNPTSWVI